MENDRPQNPLIAFGNLIAGLLILNLLTILLCLPILTAGAAFSALYYAMFRLIQGDGHPIQDFFRAFRRDFKQATPVWLILLLMLCAIAGMYVYLNAVESMSGWALVIFIILCFWFLAMFSWVFPLVSRFANRLFPTLRNAMLLGIVQFPRTVALVLLNGAFLAFALFFTDLIPRILPAYLAGCFSVPAYFSALLVKKPILGFRQTARPADDSQSE